MKPLLKIGSEKLNRHSGDPRNPETDGQDPAKALDPGFRRDDGLKAWDDGLKAWDDGLKAWDDGLKAWDDGLQA